MVLDQTRISELNYNIKRLNYETQNLTKLIDRRKKSGLLDEQGEYALEKELEQKKGAIATLESEIRSIENAAIRASNLREGSFVNELRD